MQYSISLRERQLIALVAKGKQNKQIALELHLTEGTIKEYLSRTYKKIGIRNRTELAIWAWNNKELVGELHRQ
jgi:DNA-binding NarL/FixJ family response regulator